MTRSTGEKLIQQHQACVDAIADTLRDVGYPVVCGGVDTGPNGGHTAETICDAIRSLAAFESPENPKPDYPFTTDGCSGGMSLAWKILTGHLPPWEGHCVEHDRAYHKGGSRKQRKQADITLRKNVASTGHWFIAWAMYLVVRVGGHPLLPFPWRWGYGWRGPRGYQPSPEVSKK